MRTERPQGSLADVTVDQMSDAQLADRRDGPHRTLLRTEDDITALLAHLTDLSSPLIAAQTLFGAPEGVAVICPPCRSHADAAAHTADKAGPGAATTPDGHAPAVCRDRHIQPAGCPCQHKPARSAQHIDRRPDTTETG